MLRKTGGHLLYFKDDRSTRRKGPSLRFDLERSGDLARLEDPLMALAPLRGLVVLDEVHRLPEVFATLRVLADRPRKPCRFLILGSASPRLLRQSDESLAGRIAHYELTGFSLAEVGVRNLGRLWLRGGLPRSYLGSSEAQSLEWRVNYLRTFRERHMPQFGVRIPAVTLRRFWTMLAHHHGQTWNASELARSLGVDYKTTQRYLDLLSSTFVVRKLQPRHENLRKRQVKSPKIYLADSGLLHTLLGLGTSAALEGHPKVGASREGFLLDTVIQRLRARPEKCYFWATHSGAELGLLVVRGLRRYGFEFERTVAPRVTRSMHAAIECLGLTRLTVVHGRDETFQMQPKVRAVGSARLVEDLQPLR